MITFTLTKGSLQLLWNYLRSLSDAIEQRNAEKIKQCIINIARWLAICAVVWGTVYGIFCLIGWRPYFKTVFTFVYAVAAVAMLCSPENGKDDVKELDEIEVEENRQTAEEDDEDMTELMFDVACEVSENTPVIRPRDLYSIQTSTDGHIYMDGALPVHRFELRCDREIDRAILEAVTNELQACMNRKGKRSRLTKLDGHAPVIYDIRSNGTFFSVEVVRYLKKYEDQIKLRQRARIARKLKEADAYDCDV